MGGGLSCSTVLPAPYKGIKDVFTRVVREGGMRGLYRGVCKCFPSFQTGRRDAKTLQLVIFCVDILSFGMLVFIELVQEGQVNGLLLKCMVLH